MKRIGKWPVDMLLVYTIKRQNIMPFDDFHCKKTMLYSYALTEKSKLKVQMKEVS